jgi:Protein of unknown function (DUF3175)
MTKQQRPTTSKAKTNKRGPRAAAKKKWSQCMTRHGDALDLEASIFTKDDPKAIAASLKRLPQRGRRRTSEPCRSAMSTLTFYINRAGAHLPQKRRRLLERAKAALREAFGRS